MISLTRFVDFILEGKAAASSDLSYLELFAVDNILYEKVGGTYI